MKNLSLLFVLLLATATMAFGQVKTPAPSPKVKVEQQFGLTNVTLEYSRPGVKDRVIFGDLVPYDKMWRTGANKNTMITFDDAVTFAGTEVEAGTYALFTKPGKQMWEVYLYTDTENWGTPENWDDANVAAKTTVKSSMNATSVETFQIGLENITSDMADLVLSWENTQIAVALGVATDKMAMESIDAVMAGPSARDMYNAARYYRENGKDLDKALDWMTKAVASRGEEYWNTRQLALIQADKGDYKGAIETAEKSIELAKTAGSDNYVKFNEASIAEWKKMK